MDVFACFTQVVDFRLLSLLALGILLGRVQTPMFTASGLQVRSLKVFEKSNYETTKWVRYVTKGGQYQIRM